MIIINNCLSHAAYVSLSLAINILGRKVETKTKVMGVFLYGGFSFVEKGNFEQKVTSGLQAEY